MPAFYNVLEAKSEREIQWSEQWGDALQLRRGRCGDLKKLRWLDEMQTEVAWRDVRETNVQHLEVWLHVQTLDVFILSMMSLVSCSAYSFTFFIYLRWSDTRNTWNSTSRCG